MPAHLRTFDVYDLFEKAMGFPLHTYCEFLVTFAIHALEERSNEQTNQIADCGKPSGIIQVTSTVKP